MIRNYLKLNNKNIKAAIIYLTAALLFTLLLSGCESITTIETRPKIQEGIEIEVEIKEGMNLTQIAELLADEGVIEDAFVFRLFVQQKGKEKNLLPGTYRLISGSEYDEILKTIMAGEKQVIYKLLIPEGFTLEQVQKRILESIPFIEPWEIIDAMNIENYRQGYGFLETAESLEGFLFPKTYDVTAAYSAKNIIEMLLTQYSLETGVLDWTYAYDNEFTSYDIVKIASLIEREAYIPDERTLISAVIHNRLEIDMLLQIDATVRYALDKWDGIVTYDDLEVDSPYNTYKYPGLPPTPICSPGIASIEAALMPADVTYLYYAVINEETREHQFSNTYQEHINAINR